MTRPALPSRARMRGAVRLDFWTIVLGLAIVLIGWMLVWPIGQVLVLGFINPETQTFTTAN